MHKNTSTGMRSTPFIHPFYYLALLFTLSQTFSTFVHAWSTDGTRKPSFARSKSKLDDKVYRFKVNPEDEDVKRRRRFPLKAIYKKKVSKKNLQPLLEQELFDQSQKDVDVDVDVDAKADIIQQVKNTKSGRMSPLKAIYKKQASKKNLQPLLEQELFDQSQKDVDVDAKADVIQQENNTKSGRMSPLKAIYKKQASKKNLQPLLEQELFDQSQKDVDVDAKADVIRQEKNTKRGRISSGVASSNLPYYIDTEAAKMKQTRRKIRSSEKKEPKKPLALVTNPHELRAAVLDRGILLKEIAFNNTSFVPRLKVNATKSKSKTKRGVTSAAPAPEVQLQSEDTFNPLNHEVIKLIEMRAKTKSKPSARAVNDTATLALSIEGGGMRGAVSAGMASAIAVLGLSDSFDSIYGSSAGSVVGAYMVSRQMCIDVYTDVLTTAKSRFASKGRLASSLATNLIDTRVLNRTMFSRYTNPAMNISFVLDSIMCPRQGLRPLDLKTFQINDERQQLRVVTSTVREGKMETHCLGSRTMDFFDKINNETGQVIENATTMAEMDRHGFFACLETSMLVPAATGPPLSLIRNRDAQLNITTRCFDAFCYEPIPYRSAVEEGATHVLVLKTRPDGSKIGTKPGLFEKVFAPMYFDTNKMPEVADYFKNGGQQYIYTEDYLTLDEGKAHVVDDNDPSTAKGVIVPPRKILYGVERDEEAQQLATNRHEWKRAHLLPLAVPEGKPELNVLSVDQDEVLEGVRLGFAAAFNMLAPAANVELNAHLDGERVAELLFSHVGTAINVLEIPVPIAGDFIWESEESHNCRVANGDVSPSTMEKAVERDLTNAYFMQELEIVEEGAKPCSMRDASELLDSLPGFRTGKMQSLSKGLHQLSQRKTDTSL